LSIFCRRCFVGGYYDAVNTLRHAAGAGLQTPGIVYAPMCRPTRRLWDPLSVREVGTRAPCQATSATRALKLRRGGCCWPAHKRSIAAVWRHCLPTISATQQQMLWTAYHGLLHGPYAFACTILDDGLGADTNTRTQMSSCVDGIAVYAART
jgi:hypothetical protein